MNEARPSHAVRDVKLFLGAGPFFGLGLAALLLAGAGSLPSPACAQEPLECGAPVRRTLFEGETHTYRFSLPVGATAVVMRSDVSGTIGFIRLRALGPGVDEETCTDELTIVGGGGETMLEVSDCIDDPQTDDTGDYTLVLQVVSDDADNCAQPLACGATPDGVGLVLPGEVDSFSLDLTAGDDVQLSLTELDPVGPLRLRVFGPDGRPVPAADDCDHPLEFAAAETGLYTLLVGSCGRPRTGLYRLEVERSGCPEGPTITYFGVTTSDTFPLFPDGRDALGRPVYEKLRGAGFSVVVEAKPGMNRRPAGLLTVDDPVPDLQMLVSRPLGDGNPALCDIVAPLFGGVPAVADLDFSDPESIANALNDLGCRFNDGQGNNLGRTDENEACTRSNQGFGFAFVDPTTSVQFCSIEFAPSWGFAAGDTVVAARLRDSTGVFGARREIVVRVAGTEVPTTTGTPTFQPTATRTPTRLVTKGCVADCDGDSSVEVNEVIVAVDIALGQRPMSACESADDNGDGSLVISELVHGVSNVIGGCHSDVGF